MFGGQTLSSFGEGFAEDTERLGSYSCLKSPGSSRLDNNMTVLGHSCGSFQPERREPFVDAISCVRRHFSGSAEPEERLSIEESTVGQRIDESLCKLVTDVLARMFFRQSVAKEE